MSGDLKFAEKRRSSNEMDHLDDFQEDDRYRFVSQTFKFFSWIFLHNRSLGDRYTQIGFIYCIYC